MKTLAISANLRKGTGKADSKALRNQGNVPCVLYGGEKQVCFYAHENDFRNLVYTPDVFIVELDIEGEKYKAVMQDLQFHPVTDNLLHIDFLQVFDDKEVTVTIPVNLTGNSVGIRNGGILSFRRRKIITRAIPGNLPDYIEVDIEDVGIGQSVYIKDLRVDEYTFLAPDNAVVVGVRTARNVIEETEDEEEGEEGEATDGAEGASEGAPAEGTPSESAEEKPAAE